MRYALLLCFALLPLPVAAQTVISGRLHYPKFPGGEERTPLTAINLFAAHERPSAEPVAFRSWEMAPSGWYKLSGREGRYAIFAGTPGHYIRPVLLHNIYAAGEVHKDISPRFDYALFDDSDYDRKAAAAYYQPFVAQGTSVTSVGFRLVHDGVDGAGPGAQNVVVSIHRVSDEAPEKWKQIGPTALAVDVDCGGPKTYAYSVGWNSGEVRLEPGQRYAVRIAAEKEGAPVQTHWKQVEGLPGCVRIDRDGKAATQEHALWLAIGTDGDGLVIPYNKRVHKQFVELTTCQPKWSQTYVARGKSLAAVQLYAAVSGAQP